MSWISWISWGSAEYFGAVIVIAGVTGEYIASFSSLSKRDEQKALRVGKRSTLILILGLVVELIAVVGVNVRAEQAVASSNRLAAAANKRAGEAKERAAIVEKESRTQSDTAKSAAAQANERAGKADERAGEAGRKAAEANKRAGTLELKAEKLRRENIEAAARLETERRARLALEAEISPRRLSPEQRTAIATDCRRFFGHNVDIRSKYQADVEAAVIARQIAEAGAEGGLEVKFSVAPHLGGGPMLIGIEVSPGNDDLDFASSFVQILTSDGQLENVSLGPGSGSALTIVQVGVKPIK